ncbi:MAG: 50S ribosomal protein L21 [Patescibacteria group bacterium]
MIAVIKTGGKQYLVKEGDELKIEKVEGEKDSNLEFEVLMLADEDGEKLELGTPTLGASVQAKVVEQGRGKKVTIIKFKSKSRYRRKTGHRQPYSKVKIAKV